jgi:hypothetical protein
MDDGLSGRLPMAEALAGYERRRNEATIPEYHANLAMARLEPSEVPAEQLRLRAALRGDEAETRRFYLAVQGMVDPRPFFDPDNVRRVMAAGAP